MLSYSSYICFQIQATCQNQKTKTQSGYPVKTDGSMMPGVIDNQAGTTNCVVQLHKDSHISSDHLLALAISANDIDYVGNQAAS